MQKTGHAQDTESKAAITSVIWNGEPFYLVEDPCRESHITRTKIVAPELRQRYNKTGWPRDKVVHREHELRFTGDETELILLTSAEEAEDEMPDEIRTERRDTGTFRDAVASWRGRKVHCVVSARLRAQLLKMPAPDNPAAHFPPQVFLSLMNTLKGGIIVPRANLPDAVTPDDRIIVNLLIASQPDKDGACLTLREIADVLNVSDETIRRRRAAIEETYPQLKKIIASFRPKNARGVSPDALASQFRDDADQHNDED